MKVKNFKPDENVSYDKLVDLPYRMYQEKNGIKPQQPAPIIIFPLDAKYPPKPTKCAVTKEIFDARNSIDRNPDDIKREIELAKAALINRNRRVELAKYETVDVYITAKEAAKAAKDHLEELEESRDRLLNEVIPPKKFAPLAQRLAEEYRSLEENSIIELTEHLKAALDILLQMRDEKENFIKAKSILTSLASRQNIDMIDQYDYSFQRIVNYRNYANELDNLIKYFEERQK